MVPLFRGEFVLLVEETLKSHGSKERRSAPSVGEAKINTTIINIYFIMLYLKLHTIHEVICAVLIPIKRETAFFF